VEAAAFVPHEISGLFYRRNVQAGYVGTGFGQAYGDALPEAARRARYEGDLAIKPKIVEDAH
jgi:hypothetical protein